MVAYDSFYMMRVYMMRVHDACIYDVFVSYLMAK